MTMKPWRPLFLDVHPSPWRRATASMRLLPASIIAGTQAGGTTSLFTYLGYHPLVMRSKVREVHYFDYRFDLGDDWYRAFFPLASYASLVGRMRGGRVQTGESTPAYMFYPQAVRRMAQTLPNAKVIVLLRDPVMRAFSQYHKMVRKGQTDESFEAIADFDRQRALHDDWRKMAEDESFNNWRVMQMDLLTRGHYGDQVATLLEHYPPEQLMVIQSEAMFADPHSVYRHVLDFLGLPAFEPSEMKPFNVGKHERRVSEATEAALREYFAPHDAGLAEVLGVEMRWEVGSVLDVESRAEPGRPRVVFGA